MEFLSRLVIVVAGVFLLMPSVQVEAGKKGRIEEARQRVRANKARAKEKSGSDRVYQTDSFEDESEEESDGDDDGDTTIAGEALFRTLTLPFWGPAQLLGDQPGRLGGYRFVRHPYADGDGHTRRLSYLFAADRPKATGRLYSLRLQSGYERHAADLEGFRLRATLRTASRFNFDGSVTRYQGGFGGRGERYPLALQDFGDVLLCRFSAGTYVSRCRFSFTCLQRRGGRYWGRFSL